jgi:hypothetical protein
MILNECEERDLLHAVSLIRRILKTHGVIDKDVPASLKRCAKELCTYEATKITEIRDDVPEATDVPSEQ